MLKVHLLQQEAFFSDELDTRRCEAAATRAGTMAGELDKRWRGAAARAPRRAAAAGKGDTCGHDVRRARRAAALAGSGGACPARRSGGQQGLTRGGACGERRRKKSDRC